MTIYSGETLVVYHTAVVDGVSLTDTDVTSVSIQIFNADGDSVVDETNMMWDDVQERWEYVWETVDNLDEPLTSGTYRAKVKIYGLDDSLNWEYKRIRLARNPVE